MTYKTFALLFGAALSESDKDRYIAEWASSSVFHPDPEAIASDYDAIVKDLYNIWWVANLSIADIKAHVGMTNVDLTERFCVPVRTVENWSSGQRSISDYQRLMIADLLGLVTVKRE